MIRCDTCLHSRLNEEGHCYMFREKPESRCAQWRDHREPGRQYTVAEMSVIYVALAELWSRDDDFFRGRI